MNVKSATNWGLGGAAAVLGVAAASYAAYVGTTWSRYGEPAKPAPGEADPFLDRFMPVYDVVDRHHLAVEAPADVTFESAMTLDLRDSRIIRAIFKARELALASDLGGGLPPGGLVEVMKGLGWRVLLEVPGREVVLGSVTKPWKPNPVFIGIPPEEFRAFAEPDYVKIIWTLRADPVNATQSIVRTETRALATDPVARSKFRPYWSCVSPGILLIREISLRLVKRHAEHRDSQMLSLRKT